jgi:hypothetical protein
MSEAMPYSISKRLVWEAWVRKNQGTAGVDDVLLATFEKDLFIK